MGALSASKGASASFSHIDWIKADFASCFNADDNQTVDEIPLFEECICLVWGTGFFLASCETGDSQDDRTPWPYRGDECCKRKALRWPLPNIQQEPFSNAGVRWT
jgi:hypothetical protein